MVSLFALYLSLTLAFGGLAPPTVSFSLDPWLGLSSPGAIVLPWERFDGLTAPGLVWVQNDITPLAMQTPQAHERGHIRQIQTLGAPGFFIAYAATLGGPFEDYYNGAYHPPPWDGRAHCPMFTWSPSGGLLLWSSG